jgi:hypothetical protein
VVSFEALRQDVIKETYAATVSTGGTNVSQITLASVLRTNLFPTSEPLLADLSSKTGTLLQGSFTDRGLSNGLSFPAVAQSDYGYETVTVEVGKTYTISAYVRMADQSAPVPGGNSSTGDFCLVINGTVVANPVAIALAGTPPGADAGLYRVTATVTIGSLITTNAGISRYTTSSGRGFLVSGIQVEVAAAATSYIKTAGAAASVPLIEAGDDITQSATTFGKVLSLNGSVLQLDRNSTWAASAATITRSEAQALLAFVRSQRGRLYSFTYVDATFDGRRHTARFEKPPSLERLAVAWWSTNLEIISLP